MSGFIKEIVEFNARLRGYEPTPQLLQLASFKCMRSPSDINGVARAIESAFEEYEQTANVGMTCAPLRSGGRRFPLTEPYGTRTSSP